MPRHHPVVAAQQFGEAQVATRFGGAGAQGPGVFSISQGVDFHRRLRQPPAPFVDHLHPERVRGLLGTNGEIGAAGLVGRKLEIDRLGLAFEQQLVDRPRPPGAVGQHHLVASGLAVNGGSHPFEDRAAPPAGGFDPGARRRQGGLDRHRRREPRVLDHMAFEEAGRGVGPR